MNRWGFVGLLAAVAVASFLRVGDLSQRPLHSDEAINAYKLEKLWSRGQYTYDPHEYHGPTLYYFSLPVVAVASLIRPEQPDEVAMRAVPVIFSIGLILLLALAMRVIPPAPLVAAGLAIAVSPAMVYYSRYYIHEVLLLFFTFLVLVALLRYRERPGRGWAMAVGAGIGCMYATKETFVLAIAAMAGAWVLTLATGLTVRPGASAAGNPLLRLCRRLIAASRSIPINHWIWAIASGGLVFVVFFTSFLTHWEGTLDAVRTYLPWTGRAGGASPHVHPWNFYFERLGWLPLREAGGKWRWWELAMLAFAMPAFGGALWSRQPGTVGVVVRFLGWYTLLLAAIYCVIPYKTPWCMLGFLHGVLLLAGFGMAWFFSLGRCFSARFATGFALALVLGALGFDAWRSSRELAADFRNPFVYGHTSADVFNLLDQIHEVSASHPDGRQMPIEVMAPDNNYWPLPWYLRRFDRVGWWDRIPEKPFAPVIVAASKLNANLEEKSKGSWIQAGMFELRPRFFVELYVESTLWKKFLERRSRE